MYSISVIIPFYSNKLWLDEAIKSVFNQRDDKRKPLNMEVIVINDGSNENIDELQNKYRNSIIFIHQNNKGAAAARNVGIEHSQGDYIAFLDSDDLWLPDKIISQVKFMSENNYQWSHTDYIRFWDKSDKQKYVSCNLKDYIYPMCLVWNPIATPCVMIRRDLIKIHDFRFEEGKNIGEDSYLWQEIGKENKLGYLPYALTKVRIRGTNAAFVAKLQLQYRASQIETTKNNKSKFHSIFVFYLYLYSLYYCKLAFNVCFHTSRILKLKAGPDDYLYKIGYSIPYLIIKLIKKLIKFNQCSQIKHY